MRVGTRREATGNGKKALVFAFAICAVLFALGASAEAQQPQKTARIGFLGATSFSVESARVEAFRSGLRELGYVERKNIVIEWRWAEEKIDQLPRLGAELVRINVEVIVTGGSTSTRAAKEVTTTIPIVASWPISRNVPTQFQRRDPPDFTEGTHPISGGPLRFLS